ncbi:MAG: TolC family protein, partial [Myxococcales bacterium]|nr:TolC family protein [Myxococcales bacterium]
TEALRGLRVELARARAAFLIARVAMRLRRVDVEHANRALASERARYAAGRATINDVLEDEATLRRLTEQRELAALQALGAWIQFQLARGGAISLR